MDADIREQLFDLNKQIAQTENTIKKSCMLGSNKQILEGFEKFLYSRGLSILRIVKYLRTSKTIAEIYDKPFSEYTKNDCDTVMMRLRQSPKKYKPNTINDFIGGLRMLFKYIDGADGKAQSPRTAHLIKKATQNKLRKEDLISESELLKIISAMPSKQYQCIISLLYESGARPSEIRAIQQKDISQIENGYKLNISGKTGQRTIFSVSSAPLLREIINNNPYKEAQTPLFYALEDGKPRFCQHKAWESMFGKVTFKVLGRKLNLYRLRHSRATTLIERGFNTSIVKSVLGHSRGSNTLEKTYLHLNDGDLLDAYCTAAGHENKEKKPIKNIFQAKVCRCGNTMSAHQILCEKCGTPDKNAELFKNEKNELYERMLAAFLAIKETPGLAADIEKRLTAQKK
ncbi:tyrosine-type recombinase/integrase [archaeon]|nr:tyrosine-type recombinase/integrase [Nanoarchaeota archaeon]MBU4300348.1 tyrosine-type recombinase/integrase [Nanoarchaeota archaeon]MBU4452137.1 tyrosine-type recombinase/integrase [Nanoarchaeota archaeon]MCG2724269.1 tyrosine-type recombinase/integrase [archaeon]